VEYSIKTGETIFTAWHSEWNRNTYVRREPFCEQPCLMNAGSTAGAPVVFGDGFLAGLINQCDAVFEWDGSKLTVTAPDGILFVSTAADGVQRWAEYHQALGIKFRKAPFGLLPEYCTWVEQAWQAAGGGFSKILSALTPELINSYLNAVKRAGWSAGRFTVDAGWSPFGGPGGFGDWIPRASMNMPAIAEQILSHGHIPGLWLAPALIACDSLAAQQNSKLIGIPVQMNGECEWTKYSYLAPSEDSQALINSLFRRVFDWGFRKFKLDIFYGPKPVMHELSRQCRVAADLLPEPVELEGHIPDPFCARYMDVIRLNDLMISKKHLYWREVYEGHLYVCRHSALGMVLNLDHVGGNCADVNEAEFIEHLEMLQQNATIGYPCLSLLPQHAGFRAVERVTERFGA